LRLIQSSPAFPQKYPDPTDQRYDKKGINIEWHGRQSRQQLFPQSIVTPTMAKRIALPTPGTRATLGRTRGTLTSKSAVAHNTVPAPKAGTLAAGPAAVPDSNVASPMANTRNPPATRSFLDLKYFRASNAIAITSAAASMPTTGPADLGGLRTFRPYRRLYRSQGRRQQQC
jgi:hypothetical protein